MRTVLAAALGLFSSILGCDGATPYEPTSGGAPIPAGTGEIHGFDFEADETGQLPDTFVHVLGDWVVANDEGASSGSRVLRQSGEFASPDFPRVLLESLTFADPRVSVRCRMDAGDVDQACGLLFRARDSENYYVTRANALEGNIRLYRVVEGERQEFASADREVSAGAWHTLEVRVDGSRITVSWDGVESIAESDETFSEPGKVGIWVKADSITSFDDFEVAEEGGDG